MVQSLLPARKFWLSVFFLCTLFTVFAPIYTNAADSEFDACVAREKKGGASQTAANRTCTQEKVKKNQQDEQLTAQCDIFHLSVSGCFNNLLAVVSQIVIKITGFFLGLTGVALNYVIKYTVVDASANIVGNDQLRIGMETAWSLIRDLINMSFIFILLYQAIKMIIGQGGDASKVVVKVVAVALLINFSLFITRVVVDASNVISVGFYDAIAPQPDSLDGGLSNAYMGALGLQTAWNDLTFTSDQTIHDTIFLQNTLLSIFIVITAFVFLAAAVMFLVRYIMIILLMILSPVALTGYILPGTKQYSDQWWTTLTSQALFAPAFMIMTWINLTFLSAVVPKENMKDFLASAAGQSQFNTDTSAIGALFTFSLIIGMAIATLIISKQIANKGGAGFGHLSSFVGGAAISTAAFAGRRTLGWGAQKLSDSATLRRAADNNVIARQAWRFADKGAQSSFDLRKTPGIGSSAFGGMEFGAGAGVGGYRKGVEDSAKRKQEEIERRASATRSTTKAYESAQETTRNAQRAYLSAPAAERPRLLEELRAAQGKEKAAKAQHDFEVRQSKARSADTMSSRRLTNLGLPSAASQKAADQTYADLSGKDKDAQKQQALNDTKAALSDAFETQNWTQAMDLVKGINISDFAEMPYKKIFNIDREESPFGDELIKYIQSGHLDNLRTKGQLGGGVKEKISEKLNNPDIAKHSSITRLKSGPNADFWELESDNDTQPDNRPGQNQSNQNNRRRPPGITPETW